MRHSIAIAIATAALWAGTALADEPAACYIAKDPTGDFVPGKVQPIDADPGTGAQIRHLMNESNRAAAKCFQGYARREGGRLPRGGSGILYGLRISPAGKLTQVSVLAVENINDAMLMACIARTICKWELDGNPDGQERLVRVPYVKRGQWDDRL
jgi:hypothetical protein